MMLNVFCNTRTANITVTIAVSRTVGSFTAVPLVMLAGCSDGSCNYPLPATCMRDCWQGCSRPWPRWHPLVLKAWQTYIFCQPSWRLLPTALISLLRTADLGSNLQ